MKLPVLKRYPHGYIRTVEFWRFLRQLNPALAIHWSGENRVEDVAMVKFWEREYNEERQGEYRYLGHWRPITRIAPVWIPERNIRRRLDGKILSRGWREALHNIAVQKVCDCVVPCNHPQMINIPRNLGGNRGVLNFGYV